ncbi:Alpha-glucosidase 2 [Vanrija pseudolonga]|uniref:Alpha-glucosidase 2 n=1 Tax=Vanrija pseudolonga TaxID=143232 RepID=A0AAF1BKY6_9TREE|nr:Alpha-glucosidase 2 [Vanrija pseudolonga]
MVYVERELSSFQLPAGAPAAGATATSFSLVSSPKAPYKDFVYTLEFPLANALRVTLTGPDRPLPPHDNVVLKYTPVPFTIALLNERTCEAVIPFPEVGAVDLDGANKKRELRLNWADSILLEIWEDDGAGNKVRVCGDLSARSYALTEHGVMRHWWIERDNLHLGLGEKAGPIDLTGRSFQITGSDSACYDAYETDPLYKHTPFLISTPRAEAGGQPRSTYAIYHATNSNALWDIGRHHDDPWGYFKTFTQDWGGLEEWYLLGKGVKQVTRTWAEIVGKPMLVGRDWLGYLASGMGLGESDEPIAQELLSEWPELCKKHDIPCSAIHFSSGYTVDPETGNRNVFTMNTKRYPDFKGLVGGLHKAGIKVVPNIKPYMLNIHPQYAKVHDNDGLFWDDHVKAPAQTRIWSSGIGCNGKGSWVDMTSATGRQWWADGVKSLIDAGMDGMWNDNNEYSLHDDEFLAHNDFPHQFASPAAPGNAKVGLLGRMINTEMVAKTSHDTLLAANPDRRPYVLTRSGNVGAFKYACGTWTGDNETSWKNLRGSQPIQLNCGISLMQSTGSDIGGFGGPLPSPELFVRWVQLGVTHARFCIHAFKPSKDDPSGASATNTPWMYPAVLPLIRDAIKWRYAFLPYFNSLMWGSHDDAEPTNSWLGWGDFASDPKVYTDAVLNGFDAWIGAGQLLSAPALFEGELTRTVYLPKASASDESLYFDLHAPHGRHVAGSTVTIATPLEHMGLLAREGAAIPIGKDYHTVTQRTGPARTTPDGVDIELEEEGGVVGLDDFRGVLIFPGDKGSHTRTWTEDDGISRAPGRADIQITYTAAEEIAVEAKFTTHDFKPLWGRELHVFLPVGDVRSVKGGKKVERDGRVAYVVEVL